MKNLPLLLGTLLVTAALVAGIVFTFSRSTSNQESVAQSELITETAHVKGPADALVTIVEFSDFQCPACAFAETLVSQVLAQYPDQVKLIYRQYPLTSIHPNAQLAAQAAEVAAEDGLFWEYHDLLFENQETWSQLEERSDFLEQLAEYAEQLGIDKGSFSERIESDHIKSLVNEDVVAGNKLNIKGTPTLYVNGQPSPASQLTKVVESIINN